MTNPNYQNPDDSAGFGGVGAAMGILPAIGGVYDTYQRSKDVKRQIAAQKAEAELAYQRSVEMWHMQNAYNSPEQQMARFGAAGLNPHLIYGQGSAGLSSGTPQYQPPNIQMRGASPPYGGAISAILPTLMSVGTWMQNMRQSEVDIQSKETNIDKAQQMISFLQERYPREIQKLDNLLSLYPYQRSIMSEGVSKATTQANMLFQEYRYRFGDEDERVPAGGTAKLKFLQELAKSRIEGAKASWTDFNVTNPQALIQMVLGGVMGMAGQTLRFNRNARPVKQRMPPKQKTNPKYNSTDFWRQQGVYKR